MKIFTGIVTVIVVFITLVLALGIRSGSGINTSFEAYLAFDQDYLFDILTDVEGYVDRKKGIDTLEILEREGSNIIRWKEVYGGGIFREYELIERRKPNSFIYKIVDSSGYHTAEVSIYLDQGEDFTKISLTEVGNIDQMVYRGLRALRGDRLYLKQEIKWLRVAILQDQLDRN